MRTDAQRLRLGLEGRGAWPLPEGRRLVPSVELGARLDGGDATEGAGVELGAGLAYEDAAAGLTVAARGRVLLAHSEDDFREWGAGLEVRLGPGDAGGRGPSASLGLSLGGAPEGTGALWASGPGRPGAGETPAGGRMEVALGYGLSLFDGRFTGTPNLGFGLSDGGARDWRIGWRLTSAAANDPGFEVALDATRREAADGNEPPEHAAMLRATIRW